MDANLLATAPVQHGTDSTTWRRPPLDGSLKVPDILKFHKEHSPQHPLFVFQTSKTETRTITYAEVYPAIRRAATIFFGNYKRAEEKYAKKAARDGSHDRVIGILAVSETVAYFTSLSGMMSLGLTPFAISTRNSFTAVAHLLQKTGALQLYVSPDSATQRLAQQAKDALIDQGVDIELLSMPQFDDLYHVSTRNPDDVVIVHQNLDDTAVILHSSGSTAFPKPIKLSHRVFLQMGIRPYFGELHACGVIMGVHPLPIFHSMGTLLIACASATGLSLACFKPSTPPTIPTPELFLEGMKATRSEIMTCVPAFLEQYSRDPDAIAYLSTLKLVVFGGAPLNPEIGERLFAEGVPLASAYGGTEWGALSRIYVDPRKHPIWEHWEFTRDMEVELIPQEGSDDLFEPVILASERLGTRPAVTNTTIRGIPAYATSDLIQKHPTLPGYWKVYGRVDDQLMLSTGEKTNPVPLEAIFVSDPNISYAIMFGRGRFQNGVLIQPKVLFDPQDEEKLAAFRSLIWPTVEKVNEFAPSHSRIFKEMIIVTRPERPFELTAKATPRRQVCLRAYDAEIEALYKAVSESSQVDVPIPTIWTKETTTDFIRGLVARVIKREISYNGDLFQNGCDSLQATWIRNSLLQALRESTTLSVHSVPANVIYMYPSISALVDFVYSLIATGQDPEADGVAQLEIRARNMRAMLQRYAETIAPRRAQVGTDGVNGANGVHSLSVLVTGTTGRLGCHLLEQLLQRPDVGRVFALNRDAQGSDVALGARQWAAFQEWGLDVGLLESSKLFLINCDTSKDRLGLDEARYNEIRNSVTDIIHNAWRVDFNLSLSSFEPLIIGMCNLINLSIASPQSKAPHIVFVSSIGVLFNPPLSPVPEEPMMDPRTAIGLGYGESKWVAEQLCKHAMDNAGARTTVVRVGQVSGDTRVGGWNTKEWVGALVSASQVLGCLPSMNESISWVPVDIVAATLIDMLSSTEPVLHLVHPHPVEWDAIFLGASEKLGIPLVPYAKWLATLEDVALKSTNTTDADKSQQTTAVTLLEFFRAQNAAVERFQLSTDKAVHDSPILARFRQLRKDDLLKSIEYWASAGILVL